MTTEERLRDALSAAAALVQPDERRTEQAAMPPGRWARRYGPIAVAASIVLIVLASVLVTSERGRGPDGPVRPPVLARYVVANVASTGTLSVRDALTGRLTATVPRLPGGAWMHVSATADRHTFYVLVYFGLRTGPANTRLYRLTIDDGGQVRALTPSDTAVWPPDSAPRTFAVTLDGTRIAFPLPGHGREDIAPGEIDVMNLSDGRRTAYRTSVQGSIEDVSWAADGRHLAFQFMSSTSDYSLRILDTGAGHDLLADSRAVLHGDRVLYARYTAPVLSADGTKVYITGMGGTGGQILELDARTGRQRRVLFAQPYGDEQTRQFRLFARDATGTALLVVDYGGTAHRIDIATGRVTTFPFGPEAPNTIAW